MVKVRTFDVFKFLKTIILYLLFSSILFSCESLSVDSRPNSSEIKVTAAFIETKSIFEDRDSIIVALWEKSDSIGLFANNQGNLLYTADSAGDFVEFSPVSDKLIAEIGDTVYAYFPYSAQNNEGELSVALPDISYQIFSDGRSKYDFGYSSSKVQDGNADLVMSHLFSFLKITIPSSLLEDMGTDCALRLISSDSLSCANAIFSLIQQEIEDEAEYSNIIDLKIPVDSVKTGDHINAYVAILPQEEGSEILIRLVVNGEMADLLHVENVPEGGFEAGKVYSVIIEEDDSPNPPIDKVIKVIPEELELVVSESFQLEAQASPPLPAGEKVRWLSWDYSDVSVDENGVVTAESEGVAIISAEYFGYESGRCTVRVKKGKPVTKILLEPDKLSLYVGDKYALQATVLPEDAVKTLNWSSANPEIATVDQNGVVTAVNVGATIITVSSGGITATCELTVLPKKAVTGIELDTYYLSLYVGDIYELKANVLPEDATDKTIYWSSDDNEIATVNPDGVVTAVSEGGTFIIAKSGDVEVSCFVNVVEPLSGNHITMVYYTEYDKQTIDLCHISPFYNSHYTSELGLPLDVELNVDMGDGRILDFYPSAYKFDKAGEHIIKIYINGPYSVRGSAFRNSSNLLSADFSDTGLELIDSDAFSDCSSLQTIDFDDTNLQSIGYSAFMNCVSLTGGELPSCTNTIESEAFKNCSSLKHINLSSPSLIHIGMNAFSNCSSLQTVDLAGTSLTRIWNNTFENCKSVTKATLPFSLREIGDEAFLNCCSLPSIDFSGHVIDSIGEKAFADCTSLKTIDFSNCTIGWLWDEVFMNCTSLTSVDMSYGKFENGIGDRAFRNCSSLSKVNLTGCKLNSIQDFAFSKCTSLKDMDLSVCEISWIGSSIFDGSSLSSLDLSGLTIDFIYDYAFSCKALESVDMSDCTVESLGDKVFASCSSLTTVNLEGCSIKDRYAQYTFSNCISLTEIDMSGCNINIGDYTFHGCKSLNRVDLSGGSMGKVVFSECPSLKTVICRSATPPSVGYMTFEGSTLDKYSVDLYVPDDSVNLYWKDLKWGASIFMVKPLSKLLE